MYNYNIRFTQGIGVRGDVYVRSQGYINLFSLKVTRSTHFHQYTDVILSCDNQKTKKEDKRYPYPPFFYDWL